MAERVDISGIKEEIRALLVACNQIGASPVDLSNGLSGTRRVQKVLKLNLEAIPVQPSYWPFVTIFVDSKNYNNQSMAGTGLQNRRDAYVSIKIVGGIWNTHVHDPKADQADDDCETLMENVELILRSSDFLNNKVAWHMFEGTTYHNQRINEEAHARCGVLSLRARVTY